VQPPESVSADPSLSVWNRVTIPASDGETAPAVSVTGPADEPTVTPVEPLKGAGTKSAEPLVDVEREFTRTEVMVGIRGEDPLAAVRQLAETPSGRSLIDPTNSKLVLTTAEGVALVQVGLAAGADPVAAVELCHGQGWAEWAEPNYLVRNGQDWTPNDPQYTAAGQYYHTKSQTNLAWDTTKGSPAIVVAVTDDGVGYNHPDLAGNIWTNPGEVAGDGVDNDGNGFVDDVRGWDVNANDNNPNPDGTQSHGTHVAGIIAARSNNAVGVSGTAGGDGSANSGVRIMPIRWDGANPWSAAFIAAAYTYAANNGAKIISASYNFDGWAGNSTVDAALTYAYGKGALLFNSAGNSGALNPARGVFTQPLFVSSLDSADVRSGFSNYGTQIDVAGHGSGILSTTTSSGGTGVSYSVYSGTSMSTPHAAGAAALIWSQNPAWTRDQVAARLLGTADSVDAINPTVAGLLGTGRVNAFRGVSPGVTLAAPVFTNPSLVTSGNQFTSVTVTVPRRLDPASVVASNFQLLNAGVDDTFGTPDDQSFAMVINGGAAYRMGTNVLTLTRTTGGNLPAGSYRLTGLSGAANLRDPFGTPLDGDANGTAGGNFVYEFRSLPPLIAGTVFEDWDGDASRDANDPGVVGRTVYLDTNGNGELNAGEPTATTGTGGAYSFFGAVPGTYTVRQATPSGWTATGPAGHTVTLGGGATFAARDFGTARNGRVYSHTFNDVNGNGTVDAGEGPAAGRTVYVDANTNGVFDSGGTNTVSSGTISVPINDNSTATHTLNVTTVPGVVLDVNVRVNLTHSYVGDLQLRLVNVASGISIPLATNIGGDGDNYTNTVFDDEAATAITAGTPPYTGTFRPVNLLSAVDGQSANGTWRLQVQDTAATDTGTITEWALVFTTGEAAATTDGLGNAFFDLGAGTHHVRLSGQSGWAHTAPADGKHVLTLAATSPAFQRTFGTVQPVAPTAPSVLVNGTDAPSASVTRSRVTSLAVTFNTPVSAVQAGAFTLTNGTSTLTNAAGGGVLTSVLGNRVTLTFDPAVAGVQGGSLTDGIWALTTDLTKVLNLLAAGGTGTAATADIRRLFGDVNSDGTVGGADFGEFGNTWGLTLGDAGYNAAFDANDDDAITSADYGEFGNRWGVQL
jgi:subtilisin family serine protease/subtilisin-like proprotein convertase family protein